MVPLFLRNFSAMGAVLMLLLPTAHGKQGQPAPCGKEAQRAEFAKGYTALVEKAARVLFRSDLRLADTKEYIDFVRLGAPVVPFIIEMELESKGVSDKVSYPRSVVMALILEDITKTKGISPYFDGKSGTNQIEIIAWWKSRDQVPAKFEQGYARWKDEKAKVKGPLVLLTSHWALDPVSKTIKIDKVRTPLGEAYTGMRELGIDALPHLVEKLKLGDADLLPMFWELTARSSITGPFVMDPVERAVYYSFNASSLDTVEERVKHALARWEDIKKDWLLPPVSAVRLKKDK